MFSFVPTLMRAILFARMVGANEKHLLTFGSSCRLVKVSIQAEGSLLRTVTDIFHSNSLFFQNGAERKRSGERFAKPLFGGSIPSRASTLPHCTPAS